MTDGHAFLSIGNSSQPVVASRCQYLVVFPLMLTGQLLPSQIKFPVFLNADILAGPGNATVVPVNAESFLAEAKTYPEYTLSVGWTTR